MGIASRLDPLSPAPPGADDGAENADANAAAGGEAAALVAAADPAARRADYRAWLAAKKAGWAAGREARKRKRTAAAETAAGGVDGGERSASRARGGAAADVAGLFEAQAAAASSSAWQVVGLAPTPEPGVFKCWAVIGGRMHGVPLRIPRTIYVDCEHVPGSEGAAALGGTLVKRTLPGGRVARYTYQV